MSDSPQDLVDVHVQLLGTPTPVYLPGMAREAAIRLRDSLSTQVEAGWMDIEHRGTLKRVHTGHVGFISIAPAWVPPAPLGNVLEQEDGSFVADGTDPQVPLGTPVNRDGSVRETYNGEYS